MTLGLLGGREHCIINNSTPSTIQTFGHNMKKDNRIELNALHVRIFVYWGSSGRQARESVDALNRIGARQAAALMKEANSMLPGGSLPIDRGEHYQVLDGLDESARQALYAIGDRILEADNFLAPLQTYSQANLEALEAL
jgi:hypothetical protein